MFLLIATLCLLLSILFVIVNTLYVKQTIIQIPSTGGQSCKIVQISDLHGRTRFLNGRLHDMVNRQNPDIVCITGDLASNRSQLLPVLEEVERINCPNILFVPGNYEREESVGLKKRMIADTDYRDLMQRLSEKTTVLENQHVSLTVNNLTLLVYGFDNSTYGNEKYDSAIDHIPHDFKVILAHSPSIIHWISQHQIDYNLLLVGHTHGGQIRLFNHTIGNYRHFHVGMKRENNRFFYINRGLGTVRLPIRWNCFPEITLLRIE